MSTYDRYDDRDRDRERDAPRVTTRYADRYEDERSPRSPRFREGRDARDSRIDPSYPSNRELIPRGRDNADVAVEEIPREFPPPAGRDVRRARSAEPYYEEEYDYHRRFDARYDQDRDRYGYGRDPRDRDRDRGGDRDRDRDDDWDRGRDVHSPRSRKALDYRDQEYAREVAAKERMFSKQEKILAALAGAALFVGGKEVYDRHESKQNDDKDVQRNYLASAALGAAGALASYHGIEYYDKQRQEKERQKMALQLRSGDDPNDPNDPNDPRDVQSSGEKHFLEKALAGTGLAGALAALTGKKTDANGKPVAPPEGVAKIQKAAQASLLAGAIEAVRIANEPGGWKGEKLKRIVTAASGAGGIDAAQKNGGGAVQMAESVLGGLLGNRVIHGSKSNIESDPKTGRSRSRSRAAHAKDGGGGGNGGLGGLAALAGLASAGFGAKKVYDNYHDEDDDKDGKDGKDRRRSRSRGRRADSDDEEDQPRRNRSRSVVDTARRSLAKFGIGSAPDDDKDDKRERGRDRDDSPPRRSSRPPRRRSRDYDSDDDEDRDRDRRRDRDRGRDSSKDRRRPRGGNDDDDDDDDGNNGRGGRDHHRKRDGSRSRKTKSITYDSDLGDSETDEREAKKLKGKQILTSTLAVVASIHAAHEVYENFEKRHARHKAVVEGRLSEQEAKKLKNKAILQDAASVGIAALGIKSAVSTLQDARKRSIAVREFQEEKAQRHNRRLERVSRESDDRRLRRLSGVADGYESDTGYDYAGLQARRQHPWQEHRESGL